MPSPHLSATWPAALQSKLGVRQPESPQHRRRLSLHPSKTRAVLLRDGIFGSRPARKLDKPTRYRAIRRRLPCALFPRALPHSSAKPTVRNDTEIKKQSESDTHG